MPIRATLRSLGHRNFRLFYIGQGLSLIGTQIQLIALPWFVYRLTESAQWLGWVAFVGQFPAVFATPLAGVIADRVNRRSLLLVTQTLAMIQATVLAVLTLTEHVALWHLVALNAGMSLVNAFDLTTRQTLLHEMIGDPSDLPNAIALNSALFNTTRLVGPAIAGLLIASVGEGICFALNALSFWAVLIALLAMRFPPRVVAEKRTSALRGLVEGFRYAAGSMPIRRLLLLAGIISLLAVPYNVLMPVLVREVLGGDARLNGWLFSAAGLGALTGGLFLASRTGVLGLVRRAWVLPVLTGLAFVGLSYNRSVALTLALVYATGLTVVMLLTTCNMALQSIVVDRLRGRVMSLYALTFLGMAPLGAMLAGMLAEKYQVGWALRIHGLVLVAAGLLFGLTLARRFHKRVTEALAARLRPAASDVG